MGLKRNHPDLFEKAKAFEDNEGDGFTWRNGQTLDEVIARAEAREIENKKKGIITTDRSSKIQRWQDIIAQEEDEDDNLEKPCFTCSL